MRALSYLPIVLLALVACEEVPPPSARGAASPSKEEASSSSSPSKPLSEEDAARASRPRPAPRPFGVAVSDLEKQEKLLAETAKTAPDRPKLLRRLAEGYIDLAADAKDQGRPEKVVEGARRKAIAHYKEIVKEHPTSSSMDEILYDLARAYEAAGDLKNARATYYDLIKKFPSSPLLGRAYYAFGVMFREEAKKDPSKWALAEQAFGEAKKVSPLSDPIHQLAIAEEAGATTNKPSAASLAAAEARANAKPADVPPPAPEPAPAPAAAKMGTDGTYVAEGSNYRLQAKFENGKIIVTEPNQVSVYEQQGSTRVFRWYSEKLKTEFLLEVAADGKSLFAYKPTTTNNRTKLTLLTAGAPSEQCKAPPLPIEVQNVNAINPNKERLYGVRKNGEVDAAGEYRTRGKHPYVTLPDGGTGGMFEVSGAADQPDNPEWKYPIKQWWLQANCDGTLVSQTFPKGKLYYVIVEYERAYQGMKFDRLGLQVPTSGNMVILDRTKTSP